MCFVVVLFNFAALVFVLFDYVVCACFLLLAFAALLFCLAQAGR